MSGICDTCKRSNVCRKPIGGIESCRLYVSGKESNYSKLFGTPERAARTLEAIPCGNSPCSECPIFEPCLRVASTEPNALLEWLRGDAE